MNYREELAKRLRHAPFVLAEIARRSGVSREWVSQAKAGRAHNLTLETATRIHQAIDELIEQARPPDPQSPQHHPGVEALANDKTRRARHHITDEEIERARTLVTPWPIADAQAAVDAIDLLRRLQPA